MPILNSFNAKELFISSIDLKYLFAYSIPLVTLISVHFKGIFSYTAPVYAIIFIPKLEIIFKDSDDIEKYIENFVYRFRQ